MEHNRGFTLIEIMITVVALAILAAIAIPNYTDYVRRGKIPEATSALQAMKTKMEQYFQDNRSYPGACVTGTPGAGQIQIPTLQYFTVSCSNLTATTFTVSAAGGGGTSGDNSIAGITFTIDQGNNRSTTVTSGSAMSSAGYPVGTTQCWQSKKGGAC